jgi:hypothetical protein
MTWLAGPTSPGADGSAAAYLATGDS